MKKTNRLIYLSFFLALVFLLSGGNQAWAASTTFTVDGGNWSNASNWSGGLPTASDEAVIAASTTVLVDGNFTVTDLVIRNAGVVKPKTTGTYALTLTGDLTCTNAQPNIDGSNSNGKLNFVFSGTSTQTITAGAANSIEFYDLTISAGASVTINNSFKVEGDVTLGDNSSFSASAGTATIFGANTVITNPTLGTLSLNAVTLAATATNVTTASSFTIKNILTLTAGSKFNASAGTITMTAAAGNLTSPVNGNSTASDLSFNNLTLNSANNLTPATSFQIKGDFDLSSTGDFVPTAGTVEFDNNASENSPKEITSSGGGAYTFFNLTVTDASNVETNTSMTFSGGATSGNLLTIEGTGTFVQTAGTMYFLESSSTAHVGVDVSNSGMLQINNLNFPAGANNTFYTTSDVTVIGSITNYTTSSATFAAPSTLYIKSTSDNSGAKTITNSFTTDGGLILNNLVLQDYSGGTSVTLANSSKTLTLTGDLTVGPNCTFTGGTSTTVSFRGATTKTLTNNGTLSFNDLEVKSLASNVLNTSSDFTISRYLYLGTSATNGALNASDGIITFSLAGDPLLTTTKAAHSFYSVKFSGAATDITNINNFVVKGNLISTGASCSFTTSAGTIDFTGTSQQKIQASGTLKVNNVTLNNSAGLILEGNLFIGDASTSQVGTLTLTNGDIDLNGDYYIEFSNTGCSLAESTGNTLVNNKDGSAGYIKTISGLGFGATEIADLGITTLTAGTGLQIWRYHRAKSVDDLETVTRYWKITNTGDDLDGNSAKFLYDESELNGNTEAYLTGYYSATDNATEYSSSASNTTTNWYHTLGTATAASDYVSFDAGNIGRTTFYLVLAPKYIKLAYFPTTGIDVQNMVTSSPLAANSTNKIIMGFALTATSTISSDFLTAITVDLSRSSAGIFSNFELYQDNNQNLSSFAYTLQKAGSVSGNTVQFSSMTEGFTAGQTEYYFIVADVDATVNSATPSIFLTLDQDGLTINNIYKKTQTITGPAYSFGALNFTLSSSNSPSSGPLDVDRTNQTLYGFKVNATSGAPTIYLTSVNIKVTKANGAEYDDFENFEVWNDKNKNGIVDGGDAQYGSTTIANIDETTGILTFTSVTTNNTLTAGEETNFILIADVKSDANASGTIKCKINSTSDVSMTSPAGISNTGPFEGNTMTIRSSSGTPTRLMISAFSMKDLGTNDYDLKSKGENEVVKDELLVIQVKAVDGNGYPQKVSSATTVSLTPLNGGTLGTAPTLTIALGSTTDDDQTLTFSTAATGNDFSLRAYTSAGMSLAADTITGIKVFEIEPTSFYTGASAWTVGSTQTSFSWTNGSSEKSLVVVKAASMPTSPDDGTDYTASANFSSPSSSNGTTGTGSVVVYEGTGNNVNISGLDPNTTYYAKVYKYTGSGIGSNYLTWNITSGGTYNTDQDKAVFTTKTAEPTLASSDLAFSTVQANSMKITWTKPATGGGTNSLVVINQANDPDSQPSDTTGYTANTIYGDGSPVYQTTATYRGFVVYNGTGNTVTVTGLTANSLYYVRVYEYNGSAGKENYLTSSYLNGSRRTLANEPTVQASNISFSDMTLGTNTSLRVNWVRGNGDNVIVVAKVGSPIGAIETPSDQTALVTGQNAAYGTGTAIGQGYIVYNSTSTGVTVTSLQYGQTYYFKAFEYNTGSGTNTTTDNSTINYNTDDATNNPNSRIADSYEPNDDLADAKFVTSDGALSSGLLTSADDADWFSFRPDFENSYENIRIKLTGLPKNYTLELYRADGRLLRRSIITGIGDETIVLNNLPEADYYVKIYSADGEYSLTPYKLNILNRQTDYNADTQ